jgi:hypothetical protein
MPAVPPLSLSRVIALAISLWLCVLAPSSAASSRDELLRRIPDDVAFCLLVQDARRHAADLLDSPFAAQFRRSALGKALLECPEARRLAAVDKHLKDRVGLGWAGLRDELFGDAVVFAFRPDPEGKRGRDQGLILVRARTAEVLAKSVERFNKAQQASGELKGVTAREHRGVKYIRREERKEINYYCLQGPVLLFSGQEDFLRQAIEREQAADPKTEPPLTRRLRELGMDRALLALWLNPRPFDAAVAARADKPDNAGARTFARCWKAFQDAGLAVHLNKDLRASLTVRARVEQLPEPARRWLTRAGQASNLWRAFPEDALLATAGRIDLAALFGFSNEFMSKGSREKVHDDLDRHVGSVLGKDLVKDVLPALGPDWGLCVTAPRAEDKGWAPRAVFALRLAAGPDEESLDKTLLSGLDFAARLVVLAHNAKDRDRPLKLRTQRVEGQVVRSVEGEKVFPPGFAPAFAYRKGYLVLGSSPDAVLRFNPDSAAARPDGAAPLLRVSFKAWRDYLTRHGEALSRYHARREKVSPEKARRRLDNVLAGLEFLDRLELSQQARADQVTFTLTVRPARPLKPSR